MPRTPISRTAAVSAPLPQPAPAWAEAYLGRVKYNSPPSSTFDDFGDHLAIHVGQAPVDAIVPIGEARVVDAEKVEHGGVRVVAVSGMFGDFVGPFMARSKANAALETTSGKPV